MAAILSENVRDSATIRDSMLRTIRAGLIRRGIANPNVGPGSDWYVRAEGVAQQLTVTEANGAIRADKRMPDTAIDEDLVRICAFYRITPKGAAGSVGPITLISVAPTVVPGGAQLLSGSGLTFEVITVGAVAQNGNIKIRALSTGTETNLEEGEVLRWVASPPFCDEKVTVAKGGLVNGAPAETNESLRGRLLAKLQQPAAAGNAQDVAESAETSTASVQKAFVYCAIQGPSTYHVAVCAAPTAKNKSRRVDDFIVNGTVAPTVVGKYVEHAHAVVTSVDDVDTDVAIGLDLPSSPAAVPPGPGGGWVDAVPWPNPAADGDERVRVTAVTSTTEITVDAASFNAIVGATSIAFVNPDDDWSTYSARIIAVSGSAGAFVLELDAPLPGIAVDCYVWPLSENAQAYVDAVLTAYSTMGPGEKTANVSALVRGYRRPRTSAGWPMTLGGHLTKAVSDAAEEVASAVFLHRTDGTTTMVGAAGVVTPQLPAVITDPPKQFVPRHIGFYPIA